MSETSPSGGSVLKGVAIGLACGVVLAVILLPLTSVFASALFFTGLIQLVYVIPIAGAYRKRGQSQTMKGVIIAAAIVLLLNATCDSFIHP